MEKICMYLMAFLPAMMIMLLIYKADKLRREPIIVVLVAFGLGFLAAWGLAEWRDPMARWWRDSSSVAGWALLFGAFLNDAIPVELTKFLVLLIFARCNKFYDENIDGFVYSGAIGLGYIAFDNLYPIFHTVLWLPMAINRNVQDVPLHCLSAISMGYFFSKGKIGNKNINFLWALVVPIAMHGIYSSLYIHDDASGWIVMTVGCMMIMWYFLSVNFYIRHWNDDEMLLGIYKTHTPTVKRIWTPNPVNVVINRIEKNRELSLADKILAKKMVDCYGRVYNEVYPEYMKELKRVCGRYFENIDRTTEKRPKELSLALKEEIEQEMYSYFFKKLDETDIKNEMYSIAKAVSNKDTLLQILLATKDYIYKIANYKAIINGSSKYRIEELEELYKAADHRSIWELLSITNNKDIIKFYLALYDSTYESCKDWFWGAMQDIARQSLEEAARNND